MIIKKKKKKQKLTCKLDNDQCKEIYKLYVQGLSLQKIANEMNDRHPDLKISRQGINYVVTEKKGAIKGILEARKEYNKTLLHIKSTNRKNRLKDLDDLINLLKSKFYENIKFGKDHSGNQIWSFTEKNVTFKSEMKMLKMYEEMLIELNREVERETEKAFVSDRLFDEAKEKDTTGNSYPNFIALMASYEKKQNEDDNSE